jgi:hypothetical protein
MLTKNALVACVRRVKRLGVLNLGNYYIFIQSFKLTSLFQGFPLDIFYVRSTRL